MELSDRSEVSNRHSEASATRATTTPGWTRSPTAGSMDTTVPAIGDVTARWSLASSAADDRQLRALLVGLGGGEPASAVFWAAWAAERWARAESTPASAWSTWASAWRLTALDAPGRHLVPRRRRRAPRRLRLGHGRRGRRHVRLRLGDRGLRPRRRRLRRRVGRGRRLHLERRGLVVELQHDVALGHGVAHRHRDRGDPPCRSWHQLRPADGHRTALGDDAGIGRHDALQRCGRLGRGARTGAPEPAGSHAHGDHDRDDDHDDQGDGPAGAAGRGRVGGHGWSLVTVGGHDAVDRRWTARDRR